MYIVYYTVYPELLEDNGIRRDGVNCGQVKIVNLAIIILAASCSSHNWCPTFLLVLALTLSLSLYLSYLAIGSKLELPACFFVNYIP